MSNATFTFDSASLDAAIAANRRPAPTVVPATVVPCDDGVIDLTYPCPFGCVTGRGRSRRPRIHRHGGGVVGGVIVFGHRLTHCATDDPAKLIVLVPASIPDGYVQDPDDVHHLLPMRLVELETQLENFQADLLVATLKADRLRSIPWSKRDSGNTARLRIAQDDQDRLEQSVKSATRVLAEYTAEIGL